MAIGNKFSRTTNPNVGDFFAVFTQIINPLTYYCFDDQLTSDVEIPYNYTGIAAIIFENENTCPTEYCAPPCLTFGDLPLRKANFASHNTQLIVAINNNDTIAAIYHRSEMDYLASMIAQYYLYDTLTYSLDSLRQWYTKMDAITGQLLIAGQFMAENKFALAKSEIESIVTKYSLSQNQLDGLNDLKNLYSILDANKADSLTTTQKSTVLAIANDDESLTSSLAKAVLMLNGYHFDPIYYLDPQRARSKQPEFDYSPIAKKANNVVVFPNPTTDELYIHIDSETATENTYQFELIDMQGRIVVNELIHHGESKVNLLHSSMPSGIYTYRIMSDQAIIDSGRVVIK
jgi:Secretion system C-terminal sorting domain